MVPYIGISDSYRFETGRSFFFFSFYFGDGGLHVALVRAQLANVYMRISISGIEISHLFMLNMLFCFLLGTQRMIFMLFVFFATSSFLKIDLHKRNLFGVGVPYSQVAVVAEHMGVPWILSLFLTLVFQWVKICLGSMLSLLLWIDFRANW